MNKQQNISLRKAIPMHIRAYQLLKKMYPHLFLSVFLNCVVTTLRPYVTIYLSASIIDELAGPKNQAHVWQLVIVTVLLSGLLAVVNALTKRWENYCSVYFSDRILTEKMLEMDFSIIDDPHTHDQYFQIIQNQSSSGWGLYRVEQYFHHYIQALMSVLGTVALTYPLFTSQVPESAGSFVFLNHPLCYLGICLALLFTMIVSPLAIVKADHYEVELTKHRNFSNRFFSFFGYMALFDYERAMDIRIYNQQDICDHYIEKAPITEDSAQLDRGIAGGLYAFSAMISMVFIGIVYVFVCLKAWAGAFGVGAVTQYIGAMTALLGGTSLLMETTGSMKNNALFLKTVFDFIDTPNHMYQGSLTTEKRSDRKYEIEFRDVSFKYPNTETYALRHVSMKFNVGKRLAIVGMNGSGKTTFIKLLCRLYDPDEGEILLNGIDIRKYRYDDYISIFSVVFQDFKLLAFSLAENIAAGKDYDRGKVMDSLEKAGFVQRAERFDKGIDAYLYKAFDQKGVEISGGEAQKIAIARALYKDAPFLILDEPTAALDPMAEAEIYSRLNEIIQDRTAIYISHRLSSCRFCDEIAVFDQGSIVQQGSHETLLEDQAGKYYELWHAQAQYYQ